jgi:hypothetical protein
MKTCPTCGNNYDDDLSFCLQDGTRLPGQPTAGIANRPTEVLLQTTDLNNAETIVSESSAAKPQAKTFRMSAVEPSSRMGCLRSARWQRGSWWLSAWVSLGSLLRQTNDVARLEPMPANSCQIVLLARLPMTPVRIPPVFQ